MTADLVKRLRIGIHTSADEQALRDEAADRIEKLQMTARGVPIRDMTALSKALDRIEKLEAALREFATCVCISNCDEKNGRVCELWACRKALDAE